ncbi:MAG: hypothetical protein J07HB67_00795, partial [halophilic archaeon J07HB67]
FDPDTTADFRTVTRELYDRFEETPVVVDPE